MRNSKVNMSESGKKLRELRGIRTRSGVSKVLNIPYSTLQSYEDGEREPSDETKQILADYYGVSKGEIFVPIETTNIIQDYRGEFT